MKYENSEELLKALVEEIAKKVACELKDVKEGVKNIEKFLTSFQPRFEKKEEWWY